MEPQWQPPHDSPPPYGPPAYGPAVCGQPGYGWSPPPQGSPWGPPAGPHAVWAVLMWGLAVVSLLAAVIAGFMTYVKIDSNSYLDSNGVTTTATVTNLEHFTGTVTVEFTTDDGAAARAEIVWVVGEVPPVGDEVQITYDPADPSYATEAGSDSFVALAVVYAVGALFALAVMVGAVVGAVLVHRRRGQAKRQRATW
jgi:hypothetical protein